MAEVHAATKDLSCHRNRVYKGGCTSPTAAEDLLPWTGEQGGLPLEFVEVGLIVEPWCSVSGMNQWPGMGMDLGGEL